MNYKSHNNIKTFHQIKKLQNKFNKNIFMHIFFTSVFLNLKVNLINKI